MVIELKERAPRVRFKHPVRVVPLDGSPRIYRTLAANLSRKGMFVRMPEPLPKGTKVALSLEAGGQALPFAEAEIAWCRVADSQLPGRYTGFGVRFTAFLNPRAPELVEYLVKNLDRGRPLKTAPARGRRRRWLLGGAIAATLALLVALVSWLHAGGGSGDEHLPATAPQLAVVAPEPEAVAPAAAQPGAPATQPAPAPAEAPQAENPSLARAAAPAAPVPVAVPPAAAAKQAPAKSERVGVAHGRLALSSGAATGLSWDASDETVRVKLELAPGATTAKRFLLAGPPRLVLDLDGRAPKKSFSVDGKGDWLSQVRVGRHGGSTRVVIDLTRAPASMTQGDDGVTLSFAR